MGKAGPPRDTVEFGIGEFLASGLGFRLDMRLGMVGGEGVALAPGEGDRTGKRCLVLLLGGVLLGLGTQGVVGL